RNSAGGSRIYATLIRIPFVMEQDGGNHEQANIQQESTCDGGRSRPHCPFDRTAPFLWKGSSQERLRGGRNSGGDESSPEISSAADYAVLRVGAFPGNRRLRERVGIRQEVVRGLWQPYASGSIDGRPGNSGARGAVTSGPILHQERDGRSFPCRAPIETLSCDVHGSPPRIYPLEWRLRKPAGLG